MCTNLLHKSLIIAFVYSVGSLVYAEEMAVISSVIRALDGDFYWISGNYLLCESNHTLLVDEGRCVSDHNLINGCTFVVVPHGFHTPQRIFVNIDNTSPKAVLMTSDDNSHAAPATITFRNSVEQDSTSECRIDNLAVYRGKNNIIDIRHDGFNITDERIIQVDLRYLEYGIEELKGELFLMNLSCSGGSGCLFFKVKGTTSFTTAKFGGSVSKTIIITPLYTIDIGEKTTRQISTIVTSTSASGSTDSLLDYATYAISAIAGFLILLFVIVLVGTILFLYRTKHKKRYR